MKIIRSFIISNKQCPDIKNILNIIDENLPPHWKKDIEAGGRISDDELEYHAYIYYGKQYPLSALFLLIDQDSLSVADITPGLEKSSSLSIDDYNGLLEDFINSVLPEKKKFLTSDTADLNFYLSPKSKELLDSFSLLANPRTGHHHLADKERWFRFLLNVHKQKEHKKLCSSTLKTLLIETYGWSDEIAEDLSHSYSECLDLISFIRSRRGRIE